MLTKTRWNEIKKPMRIMLIALAVLFGGIFIYKGVIGLMMKHYFATHENPTVTISATTVKYTNWQPQLKAVGSLRTTLGVNVTAQLSGMIKTIYFTPGAIVQAGTVLVQQNADTNIAQLRALQANAELARITYQRDSAQYKVKAVSKQQVDSDQQNLASLRAQVAEQAATVAKLTIKAPFAGRLGISQVNPGQYLNPGDNIVSLQSLDPIYVDFYLPQQALAQLKVGQEVMLTIDTFPKQTFTGKITTIEPSVDTNTRNVEVEATIPNPNNLLTPGMFANVEVKAGQPQPYLTVPQTAIAFNPYGEIAFVIKDTGKKDEEGKAILTASQQFVTTGQARGDQISILSGLKAGQMVVTSGQIKLRNGSVVKINNTVQPSENAVPQLNNEHGG